MMAIRRSFSLEAVANVRLRRHHALTLRLSRYIWSLRSARRHEPRSAGARTCALTGMGGLMDPQHGNDARDRHAGVGGDARRSEFDDLMATAGRAVANSDELIFVLDVDRRIVGRQPRPDGPSSVSRQRTCSVGTCYEHTHRRAAPAGQLPLRRPAPRRGHGRGRGAQRDARRRLQGHGHGRHRRRGSLHRRDPQRRRHHGAQGDEGGPRGGQRPRRVSGRDHRARRAADRRRLSRRPHRLLQCGLLQTDRLRRRRATPNDLERDPDSGRVAAAGAGDRWPSWCAPAGRSDTRRSTCARTARACRSSS